MEDDILAEILSRLPAKSLLRFWCVCKSWRALISSSYFITKHCSRSSIKGINTNTALNILYSVYPLRYLDNNALLHHKAGDGVVVRTNPRRISSRLQFVGSCNGLICLLSSYDYILWNPCTNDINKFPFIPSCIDFSWHRIFHGFGYDSTTQDYKVVSGAKSQKQVVVAVYALKTRSWRTVEEDTKFGLMFGPGCLLNGNLHWLELARDAYGNLNFCSKPRIVSFDLREEKFHQELVPLPKAVVDDGECHGYDRIWANGNSLFLHTLVINRRKFEIWEMKQSWTKLAEIPLDILAEGIDPELKVSCILENGEVLMTLRQIHILGRFSFRRSTHFVLYDPKEKASRTVLDISNSYLTVCGRVDMFVETLVSPVTGS